MTRIGVAWCCKTLDKLTERKPNNHERGHDHDFYHRGVLAMLTVHWLRRRA